MSEGTFTLLAEKGEPKTETKTFNFGDIQIKFVDSTGKEWTPESNEPIMTNRFVLSVNGKVIPWVKQIRIPPLTYMDSKVLAVEIEFYIIKQELI